MSEEKIRAYARATVTLELPLESVYGAGWTIEKLHEDAARMAREQIERMINGSRRTTAEGSLSYPIGARTLSIKVEAVIVPEKT